MEEQRYSLDEQDIADIAEKVAEILGNMFVADKEIMNISEASLYLSVKKSYLYELVRKQKIAYHRSRGGKLIYFKREDLDRWALGVSVPSLEDVKAMRASSRKTRTSTLRRAQWS